MQRMAIVALVLFVLAAGDAPKDDRNKKDLEKMQGDWAAVSMKRDGEQFPDDTAQALFRTVKGETFTVYRFSKAISKGTFKIDASKKPRTIDAFPENAKDKTKPLQGIYEFDGDKRLKMCFALPGKERPGDFSAKEGSEHTATVWEREKK